MKNIHVIPKSITLEGVETKHIYITSDDEIKEGDWVLNIEENKTFKPSNDEIYDIKNSEAKYYEYCKKIILTTDFKLAPDVQKIDDDFLEWFVKNPSCEEVKVVKGFDDGTSYGYNFLDYKIIIPTEEPKQTVQEYEQQGLEKYSNELVEPKQDYTSKHIEHCHNIAMESLVKEPKQETINEVAERLVKEHPDFKLEGYTEYQNGRFNGIIEGIEWQQEQDKKMYSDEEVLEIFEQFKMNLPFHYEFLVKEALQQLKKK